MERTCLLGLLLRVSGGASYRNDVDMQTQARGLRELMQRVRRPQDVPSATRELTQRVSVCREAIASLVESLVRNGPQSRETTLQWLTALLNRSKPGRHAHATPATRLGACAAWLRLCRPFLGDEKKEANAVASLDYLKSELGKAAPVQAKPDSDFVKKARYRSITPGTANMVIKANPSPHKRPLNTLDTVI